MQFDKKIRNLDIFKKVPKDLTHASNRSGLISILTTIAILTFSVLQISDYLYPQYKTMILPMRRNMRQKMKINIDITFPRVPCNMLLIQLQDAVLDQNYNIDTVQKIALDRNGEPLLQQQIQLVQTQQLFKDLRQYQKIKKSLLNHQGCRMTGDFQVNEVPGIFRFSPLGNEQVFVMFMAQGINLSFDFSHNINTLTFGQTQQIQKIKEKDVKANVESLSNTSQHFKTGKSSYFHYHIDIIPTFFREGRELIQTYQYVENTNAIDDYPLTSVYFQYHVGGIALQINRNRSVFSEFLIKLCAVIGGTFTVGSFINNAFNQIIEDRHKQYELIS